EIRVEANLEMLAAKRNGDRLDRLANVRGLRRDGELAIGEPQAQRRVLLREQADPPHDPRKLGGRQPKLVLDRVGKQVAVVRELTVDQPGGKDRPRRLEDDLAVLHPDAELLLGAGSGDAGKLLERAGGDVGLEAAGDRRGERRALDAEAV